MVASAGQETISNANGNDKRTGDKDNENTRPNDVAGSGKPQAAFIIGNCQNVMECMLKVQFMEFLYGIQWIQELAAPSCQKRCLPKSRKSKSCVWTHRERCQWSKQVALHWKLVG